MNRIELANYRDFAIEHLPAAQKLREEMKSRPPEDRESRGYEMRLLHSAENTIARKESTDAELAAASLLMGLMCFETYDPATLPALQKMNKGRGGDLKDMPNALLPGIAKAAELLTKVIGKAVVPATDAPVKPKAETAERRQARRYQLCIDAGLTMPADDYAHLPTGVGNLARAENISTAAFSKDVKAYIASRR